MIELWITIRILGIFLSIICIVGIVMFYVHKKNLIMLEMVKSGADPLKIKCLMNGANALESYFAGYTDEEKS